MNTLMLLDRSYRHLRPLLPTEKAYQAALAEIERQHVSGPVYEMLRENGFLFETPSFFQSQLKQLREADVHRNLWIKGEAFKIIEELEQRGISAIVLKGIWLSERLYRNAGIRATSDIDLLIKPEQIEAAAAALRELGFDGTGLKRAGAYHAVFGNSPHPAKQSIAIELHWHVVLPDFCRMDCRQLWAASYPLPPYECIHQLSVPDLFYTLCLHGAKHNMSSLKHILDLARMIHLYGPLISYERLLHRAREEHQFGMVVMALSVVYRSMPHLSRIKSFPQLREWFPWDQALAWQKEEKHLAFRFKGVAYYVQQLIFDLAKLDRIRYRWNYFWRRFYPHIDRIQRKKRSDTATGIIGDL